MKQINRVSFLLLIIFCLSYFKSASQNKIQLINGKVIDAASYVVGEDFVLYKTITKKKSGEISTKSRSIERFDVFSIITADSTEEMVYRPDSLDFSIEEARNYIKGEQAAHEYYHRPGTAVSSAIIGAGSSLLSFYSLPVPMVYAVILGRFNTRKIVVPDSYDQTVAKTEAFKIGYQKSARNIKIQQSLKWGYISLGVGLTAFIIYGTTSK